MSSKAHLSTLVVLIACLGAGVTAHADVYKFKDEKGNTLYTDRPQLLPAERLNIQSQRSDVVEMEQRENTNATAAADRDKSRRDAQAKKDQAASDAAPAAPSKEESCNKARQDYLSRMNAQRLYEEEANGERRYLTDAEIDSTRAAAKQAMDAVCN